MAAASPYIRQETAGGSLWVLVAFALVALNLYFQPTMVVKQDKLSPAEFKAKYGPWGVVAGASQGLGREWVLALVRRGLDSCAEAGYHIVLVVGHPEFYPRFGFSRDLARPLDSPYQSEAFMALELTPGALAEVVGTVRYPPRLQCSDRHAPHVLPDAGYSPLASEHDIRGSLLDVGCWVFVVRHSWFDIRGLMFVVR